MRRYVRVLEDDVAEISDVMTLIGKLSYLDMIEFAGIIAGDAGKIADAAKAYNASDETPAGTEEAD